MQHVPSKKLNVLVKKGPLNCTIVDAGIDPVWFGIFAVIVVEFGLISPPVGMNLFVIKGVMQKTPLQTIWFGTVPFLLTDVIRLALIIAFPAICLYLPSLMTP